MIVIGEPCGAYFAALSKRLNSTCSINTMSRSSSGKPLSRSISTEWYCRILSALCKVAPMISERSAGPLCGLSGPDSSLVMSRRLPIKRLSRSASSAHESQPEAESAIFLDSSIHCNGEAMTPPSLRVYEFGTNYRSLRKDEAEPRSCLIAPGAGRDKAELQNGSVRLAARVRTRP